MFRRIIILCISALMFLAARAQAQLPAFPGADGAGAFTSGGRGGIVYHVTKLDRNFSDTSSGTLRYGLNDANFPAGTKRTIVFEVAGTFWLGRFGAERPDYDNGWDAQSVLNIPKNVTIAGQSAPGPVIIMGGVTKCGGTNVIIRNVTFAPGYGMRGFNEPDKVPPQLPTPGDYPDASIYEALQVSGQNVMLDHLTAIYGTEGTIWCRDTSANVTLQYSTIAQAENYPQNVSGTFRGLGVGTQLQSGVNAKVSYLNNLNAQLKNAVIVTGSPTGTDAVNDIRNNVIYNWIGLAGYGGGSGGSANFINNFYLAGPGGDDVSSSNIITLPGGTSIFTGSGGTTVYVSGNRKDINKDGDPNDTLSADGDYFSISLQPAAYDVNIGVTLDSGNGFTNVLHYAGARWWDRDYDFTANNTNAINTVEERLIYETWTGTGKVMAWADDPFTNNPTEGLEWRAMLALRADSNTFAAPFNRTANWDTDQDGMPDYWELEHGLNAAVANNNDDFDNDGYTDLEEYLNEMAAWPAPGNIIFNGNTNNRYALVHNWQVNGVVVNITNLGLITTSSKWQPSRYDTAIISNATVIVDAVGQHAGTLRLAPDVANNATLNLSNGWLKVANTLEIAAAGTAALNLSGGRLYVSNLVMGTGSGSFNFTGGTLSADVVGFDLLDQGGTIAPGSSPGNTHMLGDLTLQSGSSLALALGSSTPGQFDTITVDGDLALGGTLNVTNLPGFGLGTYPLITYGGSLGGSLTIGSKPAGFDCFIDTSTPGQVSLVVVTRPVFQSIQTFGGAVVIRGVGPTNVSYRLVASADLLLPLNLWTPVATNGFNPDGSFSITNLLDLNQRQTFYRLQLQ